MRKQRQYKRPTTPIAAAREQWALRDVVIEAVRKALFGKKHSDSSESRIAWLKAARRKRYWHGKRWY